MEDATSAMGPSIRHRRQALGLSLDALSVQSGVSSTMISEVERSVKSPTVRVAYQIARALNCSLTDLLDETSVRGAVVTRAEQRRTMVDPETGITRHGLATELLSRSLELAWYELPPGASTGELAPNRPGLLEHITVLHGQLTVVLDGVEHRLGVGDSIGYGVQRTEYRNDDAVACECMLVSDSSQVH